MVALSAYKAAFWWQYLVYKIHYILEQVRIAINHLSLGDFRRRLMMGISTAPNNIYPDRWVDDGWIWCYYDVEDTENPTTLLYNSTAVNNMGSTFIIDGVEVARAQTYTFSTTGEHLVKMKRNNTQLPNNTYYGVAALKRVYLSSNITNVAGYSTSGGAFFNCTGLTHVYLPSVTTIGASVFNGCSSLGVINLDNSDITSIGQNAFYNCSLSDTTVKLPNLTSISSAAFMKSGIKKVLNLGRVTSLPSSSTNGVFTNCTSLSEIVFPSTLTTLGGYCFNNCSSLTGRVVLDYITSLGERTFSYSGITEIVFSAIASLGNNVLRYMNSCLTIDLPSTVTSINQYSIRDEANLETLILRATTPPSMNGYNGINSCAKLTKIYVPYSADQSVLNAYKTASNWSRFASKMIELDANGNIPTT